MNRTNTVPSETSSVDVANVSLGIALGLLPWAFSHGDATALWSAGILGALIALVAAGGLFSSARWEKWAALALGAAAAVAPWALGFADGGVATYAHLAIGVIVAALAAGELLLGGRRTVRPVTAARIG